jgi:hypothetical protein
VTSGVYDNSIARLRPVEAEPLPKPIIPSFANSRARGFTAQYINKGIKGGQDADLAPPGQPIGWRYIQRHNLSANAAWVRMHLLPARLGGPARGQNLVPASGPETNTPFLFGVEGPAYAALISGAERMIWYRVTVMSHPGPPDGFPSYIKAEYRGYRRIGRGQWEPKSPGVSFSKNPVLPSPGDSRVPINRAGRDRLMAQLGIAPTVAQFITDNRPFANIIRLTTALTNRQLALGSRARLDLPAQINLLMVADRQNRLRFD